MNAKPFVPFTLVISDQSHTSVNHPELAWLTKLFLYVTTDGGETTKCLYSLHITQILRQESEVA